MHARPVRRGLVGQPTDGAWCGARFQEGRPEAPLYMGAPFG